MWMMGYNEGAEFSMPDSFNGRKLRPLIPRPITSPNNSPCLGRINGSDFFALNHHLGMGDQNKREFNTQQPAVVVSSRWNPTPEQLRTLEELYRRGTRTPSADQIQHITAQLRRYGKIEGKNVFYWFQNHKARERQKRRRQMESATDDNITTDIFERKDSETNRTGYEAEQTKNWALPTNCSTLAEESVSIQMAAKASVSECRADNGWIQFEEGELPQQRKNFVERNDTWQHHHKMQFSYSCIPTPTPTPPSLTSTTPTAAISTATTAAPPPIHTPIRPMDPKHHHHHHHSFFKTHNNNNNNNNNNSLNIFKSPCRYNAHVLDPFNFARNHHESPASGDDSQTLQLFPLRSDNSNEKENEISVSTASPATANLGPNYQFFEFLPLKN